MLPTRTLRRITVAALAAVGTWSCGGSTGPGDTPVAIVALSDTAVALRLGAEAALVARATQANGEDLVGRRIFWSTRDTAVAMVSQSGVIRGMAIGATQVAASIEGRAAVARVTVLARPVTSLQVEPATVQLVVNTRQRLTARALNDAGASVTTTITWTSETPAILSVSADGEVTGLAPGVGAVRATAEGVTATAAVVVTPVPVARVTVTPAAPSFVVGTTQQLTATPTDAAGTPLTGRAVSWSSRDPSIAVVSSTGQVTGIAPGTAPVVATVEGQSATATVTVRPVPIAAVRVTPDNSSIGVGGTVRLAAVPVDAAGNTLAGRTVAFASNAPNTARVAADGTVTGVAAGTVTITATSEGVNGTATVRVTPTTTVASVQVTPDTASLTVGQTRAFTATPRANDATPIPGRAVTWSSGGPSVISVSSAGVATAVGPGTAQVLAQVDGITGTATVTVRSIPVASILVTPSPAGVLAGSSTQLTAVTRDAGGNALTGRTVIWTSSNETIALVASDGRVTGVAPGSATVRATSEGVTGSATVNVAPVVRVAPTSVTVRVNRTVQLVATDHTNRPLSSSEVTWSSSNPLIASVDINGSVRGNVSGLGTATITVTYRVGAATATATVTVTVTP